VMTDLSTAPAGDAAWPSPGDFVTRDDLSKIPTGRFGLPIAASSLSAVVTRGGGPPRTYWGRKPVYRWGTARAWARDCLKRSRRGHARPPQATPVHGDPKHKGGTR
jgi:hypothetical protein